MRHSVMVVAGLCVAVVTAQVSAQPGKLPQEQTAADLASAYQAWQQARDTEEKIRLGERVLAVEPTVEAWPLSIPRQRLRAELLADLGTLYVARPGGVLAETWKRQSVTCRPP